MHIRRLLVTAAANQNGITRRYYPKFHGGSNYLGINFDEIEICANSREKAVYILCDYILHHTTTMSRGPMDFYSLMEQSMVDEEVAEEDKVEYAVNYMFADTTVWLEEADRNIVLQ
jgi:hypothetical protein